MKLRADEKLVEEKVSNLEDIAITNTQTETRREKKT